MFHPNHDIYGYSRGKTHVSKSTEKPYMALTTDDGQHKFYDVKAYNQYHEEPYTEAMMRDVFTKQAFGLKERDGGHTTFAVYENGAVYGTISRGCHAMLQNVSSYSVYYKVKVKELWVSLWAPDGVVKVSSDNPKGKIDSRILEASVYWNYMLDPKISPWRGALKGSEIIYAEHPEKKDGIKYPIAFVIRDMDVPFQLIGSLCISSRMCWAFTGYLSGFTKLMQSGFSAADAAFITANVYLLPKDKGFGYPYTGDYAFNTYYYQDMDYDRFVNAKVDIPTPNSIHKGESYNSTNTIFGARKWTDKDQLPDERFVTYDAIDYEKRDSTSRNGYGTKKARIIPTYIQWLVSQKGKPTSRFAAHREGQTETFLPRKVDDAIDNLKKHEELWKDGKAR